MTEADLLEWAYNATNGKIHFRRKVWLLEKKRQLQRTRNERCDGFAFLSLQELRFIAAGAGVHDMSEIFVPRP